MVGDEPHTAEESRGAFLRLYAFGVAAALCPRIEEQGEQVGTRRQREVYFLVRQICYQRQAVELDLDALW